MFKFKKGISENKKRVFQLGAAVAVVMAIGFLFSGEVRAGLDNESLISVTSPNGGEEWQVGRTYNITWFLSQPVATTDDDIQKANIYLVDDSELAGCTDNGVCCYICTNWELIASVSASVGDYYWTIPDDQALGSKYKIYIRIVNGHCENKECFGDTSDDYFSIVSSPGGNFPPVITSLGGSTNLNVNQTGTWTIQAHDPDGNYLTYSVDWGDIVYPHTTTSDKDAVNQSTTFLHSYSTAGNYTITFRVTDQQGASAKSSITVQVGGSVATCTDFDGGKNYYVKGTTCFGGGATEIHCEVDKCAHPDCVGCKDQIVEYYCEGDEIQSEIVDCQNGCKDGACIFDSDNTSPKIIGFPEIPILAKTGQRYSFKWNATDADNDDLVWSVDWGDGGGIGGICQVPSSQKGQGWTFGTNYIWQKAGIYTVKTTVNDCRGGSDSYNFTVEVEDSGATCTDSDGGKDYYTKGKTTGYTSGVGQVYTSEDMCLQDGINNADLQETWCKNNEVNVVVYNCPNGCQNGACVKGQDIIKIEHNASNLHQNKFNAILTEIKQLRDIVKEQQTQIKYLAELKKDVAQLSQTVENAINNFITYGVDDNTKRLGAGERAAVMHSFKSAFKKLPETEEELADAIKIANGRWPSLRSNVAEKRAKEQFQKIYKRIVDMNNANDNAAVTVMAYGLRQKAENRNLDSERTGIEIFQNIFGYHPNTTEDWNIMQAITYSGASRGIDSDGDLLLDSREAELGTDSNNPDTDGDGFSDGMEVANGHDPLKK